MSGTPCFILFWFNKDIAFAVFDEEKQTWTSDEGLMPVLACGDYVYPLAGVCGGV